MASNKYYSSVIEWRDYEFFTCDEEQQEKTIQMLIDREFLLPSKMPNQEKLKSEAQSFANQLAERFSKSGRTKHFGLAKLAESVEKFNKLQNKTNMYYYMVYLYGAVYWRVPYNVQRFPVMPDALEIYLDTFAETLAACLYNFADSQENESDIAENSEVDNE